MVHRTNRGATSELSHEIVACLRLHRCAVGVLTTLLVVSQFSNPANSLSHYIVGALLATLAMSLSLIRIWLSKANLDRQAEAFPHSVPSKHGIVTTE